MNVEGKLKTMKIVAWILFGLRIFNGILYIIGLVTLGSLGFSDVETDMGDETINSSLFGQTILMLGLLGIGSLVQLVKLGLWIFNIVNAINVSPQLPGNNLIIFSILTLFFADVIVMTITSKKYKMGYYNRGGQFTQPPYQNQNNGFNPYSQGNNQQNNGASHFNPNNTGNNNGNFTPFDSNKDNK